MCLPVRSPTPPIIGASEGRIGASIVKTVVKIVVSTIAAQKKSKEMHRELFDIICSAQKDGSTGLQVESLLNCSHQSEEVES